MNTASCSESGNTYVTFATIAPRTLACRRMQTISYCYRVSTLYRIHSWETSLSPVARLAPLTRYKSRHLVGPAIVFHDVAAFKSTSYSTTISNTMLLYGGQHNASSICSGKVFGGKQLIFWLENYGAARFRYWLGRWQIQTTLDSHFMQSKSNAAIYDINNIKKIDQYS